MLAGYRSTVRWVFAGVLMAVFAVVAWRWLTVSAGPRVAIRYIGGPIINAPRGPTLLEISRMHGIPHASVCGGRARCSTCRVRVEAGSGELPRAHLPGNHHARQHRRTGERASRLPDPAAAGATVTRLLRPGQTGPQAAAVQEADAAGSRSFSPSCSSTCAPSRSCRSRACLMTWFSSSTSSSPPLARRSMARAAGSTSTWATGCWRCSGRRTASRSAAARPCVPPAPLTWH